MDENIIIEGLTQNVSAQTEEEQVVITNEPQEIQVTSTEEDINVQNDTTMEVQMQESASGSVQLNVTVDHSQYLPNQHTIGAITGLQEILDDIQELKETKYTKHINQANYFMWQDENPLQENREGYFVYLVPNTGKLQVCSRLTEPLGVTVGEAGFVGGQEDIPRDYKYALVVHTGLVSVRCESTVNTGDYVISNAYGWAAKNDNNYGYQVTSIANIEGRSCAIISLSSWTRQMNELADNVSALTTRVISAETNVAATINSLNQAISDVATLSTSTSNMSTRVDEMATTVEEVNSTVQQMESTVEIISQESAQARAIADTATATAENIRSQAVATANQALADVQQAVVEAGNIRNEANQIAQNALAEAQSATEGSQEALDAAAQAVQDAQNARNMAGDAVKSVEVQYSSSSSSTIAPTENWQLISPVRESGQYIWQRTVTVYMDDTEQISDATCLTGSDGKSIDIKIASSNGNFFKNGNISTTLFCYVFENGVDITDNINAASFHWSKINNDGTHDTVWETANAGGTKTVVLTSTDVRIRATFLCSVDGYLE